jgi:hypothetical protein
MPKAFLNAERSGADFFWCSLFVLYIKFKATADGMPTVAIKRNYLVIGF